MTKVNLEFVLGLSRIANTIYDFYYDRNNRTTSIDLMIIMPSLLFSRKALCSLEFPRDTISIQGIREIIRSPNPKSVCQRIQRVYPRALKEWHGFVTIVLMEIIELYEEIEARYDVIVFLNYLPLLWNKSPDEWDTHWNRARNYCLEIQSLGLVDYFNQKCYQLHLIPIQTHRFICQRGHAASLKWISERNIVIEQIRVEDSWRCFE